MSTKFIARWGAIGFFLFWLLVLLAGADFPPPIGFIWVILLDTAAAGLVYYRIPIYTNWSINRKRGRVWRVLLDGLAAGVVFAILTVLFGGGGEPSLPPLGFIDYLIWTVVLGVVGMINATGVYVIISLLNRRRNR